MAENSDLSTALLSALSLPQTTNFIIFYVNEYQFFCSPLLHEITQYQNSRLIAFEAQISYQQGLPTYWS